jgi:hypothetical protein
MIICKRAPSLTEEDMLQRKRLVLIVTISLLSCFATASAQKISVAITPASIDAKVSRGASYVQVFTLVNDTGTRLRFKCSLADMWYDENNNRVAGLAGTSERSASSWIQLTPEATIVEPHSSGKVNAVITIPRTAAGSYYSVPVFEAMPVDEPLSPDATLPKVSTAKATIGLRFNGLIMLTTLDAAEYNVEIMGGRITAPSASTELALELDIRNRGNAHVRVHGAFAILNGSGILVGRGSIEEKRFLPEQKNILPAGWAGELPAGTYTSVITLSYDRVGKEPATLAYELPLIVQ